MLTIRVDLHPVYLEELAKTDPSVERRGPEHMRKVAIGVDLAREPGQADRILAKLSNQRDRQLILFVALSFLSDHGATIDVCTPLLQRLTGDELTRGQRYQLAECYSRIGVNHRQRQDLQRSVEVMNLGLRAAEGLPPRATTSALHYNLGVAYEQWGDHGAAAAAFEESARIDIALGRNDDAKSGKARAAYNRSIAQLAPEEHVALLTAAGATARQRGNMSEALQCYLLAHQHALRGEDPELLAVAARNLSSIFFYQGEYARAEQILSEAVRASVRHGASRASVLLRAALGNVLSALEKGEDAEREFQRGLAMAVENDWPDEADKCRYGLSQLRIDRGDYMEALPLLLECQEHRRGASNVVERGNVLNQLGFVTYKLSRYDESIRYHEEALRTRKDNDVRGSAESAHSLAILYENAGDRRRALAYALRASRWYEAIRRDISTGTRSRASFQETVGRDYHTALRLACELDRSSVAFWVLQRIQNRTLLDDLARVSIDRPPSVSKASFEKERELLERVRESTGDSLRTHDVLRQLGPFYRSLRKESLPYVRWRTGEPMGANDLLVTLTTCGPGTAYVELIEQIVKADESSWDMHLFGVCAVAGDHYLRPLRSSARIAHFPPQKSDHPAIGEAVQRLLDQIRLVTGGPGHLFIVPHGPLAKDPLHTFPVGDRSVIELQAVRYLPHAGFLSGQRWLPKRSTRTSAVLGDSLSDLKGARAEAHLVAARMRVKPVLGAHVTRQLLQRSLAEADLVHVAGHAFFEGKDPMRSGLVASDGVLSANDLRRFPIRASMVVLNACESGVQSMGFGNEMNGFVRSLLQAGVRHVVCTLARVDDEVASAFAAALYDGFGRTGDDDAVERVWRAQLAIARAYSGNRHLWSPFILVG
jgi:tetratricopeptide (TPR) repeat protein